MFSRYLLVIFKKLKSHFDVISGDGMMSGMCFGMIGID